MQNGRLSPMLLALALALLWPRPPAALGDRPAGGPHPPQLAARWFEEGFQAEWRLTLRPDGRAVKERHRECLNTADQEGCMPLRYEGSWDADRARLVLHLPGGMVEGFHYALKGNLLSLTDAQGKKLSFVFQLLDAEGRNRPKALVGVWSERSRMLTLDANGSFSDRDEDGETTGSWRADAHALTLEPKAGNQEMTYRYRTARGALILQDSTGKSRTLRAGP